MTSKHKQNGKAFELAEIAIWVVMVAFTAPILFAVAQVLINHII